MRLRGRTDNNHRDIVRGLEAMGCTVLDMHNLGNGAPDIAVGFRGKNWFFEIKDELAPPSHQRMTLAELAFHARWKGQINKITSLTQAIYMMGLEKCR